MGMCEDYNIFDEEDEREYAELKEEVNRIKEQTKNEEKQQRLRTISAAKRTYKWLMDI